MLTRADAVTLAAGRPRDLHEAGWHVVITDDVGTVLELLSDRRQQLIEQRITAVNRLHQLLAHLPPEGRNRRLTPAKTRHLLANIRPRDRAAKTGKRLALDHVTDDERLDATPTAKTSFSDVLVPRSATPSTRARRAEPDLLE